MHSLAFQVRKCENPACGMRYPCPDDYAFGESCPRCGSSTRLLLVRDQYDEAHPTTSLNPLQFNKVSGDPPLLALFDNIRSAWNVGSMFRSADGAGFRQLHLCGITPTPEYPGVQKTSLGAEKAIPWSQSNDSVLTVQGLKAKGFHIWALEADVRAEIIYEATLPDNSPPLVLVVGNEICGIDPGVLEQCERTLYLPMQGIKRSYNVAVAFGIAAHYLAWAARQTSRPSPTDP